ncbi:Rhodanese-like domain-containing protein [Hyaloraphidium curvatum]|nr:Rhodanese-like domain-containing protein [Hyaloraphidium curvatum]
MSSLVVKYVEPAELAAWLRQGKRKLAVIDVRDADFPYGNIRGCINIPSRTFHDTVSGIVERFRGMDALVFHCALSQIRGPKAANSFRTAVLETMSDGGEQAKVPELYVLRGGFSRFQEEFGTEEDLVENLTEEAREAWRNGWI